MLTPRVLGVDPGSEDGAAVLLDVDERTVVRWWVWSWLDGKGGRFRVRGSAPVLLGEAEHPHMAAVGRAIADDLAVMGPPVRLALEGLFVPTRRPRAKKKKNPQSVIPLAEAAGEIRGSLWAACVGEPARPLATTWRADELHLPSTMEDADCECRAVEVAQRAFDWPGGWPRRGLTYPEEGALAEAAFIARWAVKNGAETVKKRRAA